MKHLGQKNAEKTEDTETSHLLCLVRHGEAAPKDVGLTDFERPLIPKGIKACEKVARAIAKRNLHFDLLLSSPADRALETAHLFASRWNYPVQQIQIITGLYENDTPSPIVSVLQHVNTDYRNIALFGHNPLFNQLAAYFLTDFNDNIPKGAAVGITFRISAWKALAKKAGQLDFCITPNTSHSYLPRSIALQQ